MRTLITLTAWLSIAAFSQQKEVLLSSDTAKTVKLVAGQVDSVNLICTKRGHVRPGIYMTTDIFCGDGYVVDYPDSSVYVKGGCNYITYRCARCGKDVSEKEPSIRKLIWRK